MKKKKEPTINRQAFALTRQKFSAMSYMLLFFVVFTLLSLVLAFVNVASLIITVPFLILPGLFSITANSIIVESEKETKVKNFFVMFKNYFSPLFIGGYRFITSFLLSLAVFAIGMTAISTIAIEVMIAQDATLGQLMDSIANEVDMYEALDQFLNYLNNNSVYNTILYITAFVSTVAAVYFFIHRICINNVKYIHSFTSTIPYPMSGINVIHKQAYRKIRKDFRKDYFKATWFLTLIFFVLMLGSGTLLFLFFEQYTCDEAIVISLLLTFIFLIGFIPYYLNVIELIYLKYKREYQETFIKLSLESLKEYKKDNVLDETKEKEIMDFINSQKAKVESNEEKDKSDTDNKNEQK